MDGALSSDRQGSSGYYGGGGGGRGGGYRGGGRCVILFSLRRRRCAHVLRRRPLAAVVCILNCHRSIRRVTIVRCIISHVPSHVSSTNYDHRRGRHRHHPYRRDDYGGGRHNGNNNRRYDDRRDDHRRGGGRFSGGGGSNRGPRQPANRFTTETKSVDPQYAMMKQLTAMVAKMGDLGGAAEVASSNMTGGDTGGGGGGGGGVRPVVKAIGMNVSDLVDVLCGPSNAALFLRFGGSDDTPSQENEDTDNINEDDGMNNNTPKPKQINAATDAGPLATLLHSCATGLSLQTPSYAALTLGVEIKAPSETHGGFAGRCVELGMRCLGRDLDEALECKPVVVGGGDNVVVEKEREGERCTAERTGGFGNGSQIDAYYRAKYMLRYLAHLAKIGIVSSTTTSSSGGGEKEGSGQSLLELLHMLVQCANNAASTSDKFDDVEQRRAMGRVSRLLASLVLSCIPYALAKDGEDKGINSSALIELIDELENNVVGQMSAYSSDYEPGVGLCAILLKGELDDGAPAGAVEEEEEEEEDDEEGDDNGDLPAPCADTLQDLLRTVRKIVTRTSTSRFALLSDAPWCTLTMAAPSDGIDMDDGEKAMVPMVYSGEPLLLDLMGGEEKRCKSIPFLMALDGGSEEYVEMNCRLLDGIIYGRLAIFDAPPSADDDDSDEEEAAKESNPNLESYVKTYALVDRFFLSDAIRDVLMCHRPMVSDAGADRSNAKEVAEQIWAVSHLFLPPPPVEGGEEVDLSNSESCSKGIEYGIVETMLSLIVQSTPQGCGVPASSPLNQHLYLSRVLLELTKLKPSLVPRAIVLAISGMFQDFMPSLTPSARENLGLWLSFHLTNTDYQWPKAFWEHWAPYASCQRNSRGDFVTTALYSMASLSADGTLVVVKDCLPAGSPLIQSVFLNQGEGVPPSSTEQDLINRIWNTSEEPDTIRQFIISDELTESYDAIGDENDDNSMFHCSVWWRTGLVTRALFHPLTRERAMVARLTEKASSSDGMGMDDAIDDDVGETEDLQADLVDAIARFKPVMLAALARDADAYDSISSGKVDDDQLLLAGEVSILREFGNIVPQWDSITAAALVDCLMNTKVVSGLAVTTWALGEHVKSSTEISSQWWKFVSQAVRNVITQSLSSMEESSTDLGGGIGMIIDDSGANDEDANEVSARKLDEALKVTAPIIKYSVERACQVLAEGSSDKKIPLVGADISEGIKRLLSATLFHFHSLVMTPSTLGKGILTRSYVQMGFTGMDISGEKLAVICQMATSTCKGEQGKTLLQNLAATLEKLV
eukprot:scaffold2556_cov207-Alexandrium_tamarense.AAC.34